MLGKDEPSVRYLTLEGLMDGSTDESEASEARAMIGKRGWAARILAAQAPGGWWQNEENPYLPKYTSTNWMMLILADLGVVPDERLKATCEDWVNRFSKPDGGFGSPRWSKSHLCTTGNTARALVQLGYGDHPKVRSAFRWMAENRAEKGGWSCFGGGRNLDSWEPMSAFAVLPRQSWSKGMKDAVEKGAEFFLERELHIQGDRYEPWYRFHYPVHYYYDLLVGLDFMTALGYSGDRRLSHAVEVLKRKQRSDGRWKLDAVHPDLEGSMAEWYKKHPRDAPVPFALEKAGEPSKMITLRTFIVLKRLEESA